MRDLLVVGAGPAGLCTALHAARAGLDVTVLEKRAGTIDKACGEGLMPGALRGLAELGVDPVGLAFTGITYRQDGRSAVTRFSSGSGRGVRRTTLHSALRAAVEKAGVVVHEGDAGEVRQSADHVSAGGLRARYLAAADGLHSPIRTSLGLTGGGGRPRWGLRRHYAVAPWTDTVEVTWSASSEAYVTPIGPDRVGVAVLTSTRGGLDHHLAAFGEVTDRLRGAEYASAVRGAGPLRQDVRRRVAGRVLLVGDAAGYVDALTGEGISVALSSAQVLVESLVAGSPERYERRWRQVTRPYRVLTSGLLHARHNRHLAPYVVPAAARLPRTFARVVNRLAG